MEGKQAHYGVESLDVYKLAREYSLLSWKVYNGLDWQKRKVIGDQMITSVDSVGANIAEGYGRFHYLDKNKFYYNARGSLLESKHWVELLQERRLVNETLAEELVKLSNLILIKLNSLIKSQLNQKFN